MAYKISEVYNVKARKRLLIATAPSPTATPSKADRRDGVKTPR